MSLPPHHRSNGAFRNPQGSPVRDAPFTEYLKFFARRVRSNFSRLHLPGGHILPLEVALRQLHECRSHDSVTWLGHSAFLLRMGGKTLLIDPYLSETAGPGPFGPRRYAPPGLGLEYLPPIDVLLISHNHYDHLDGATIARIPNKENVHVVVPLRLGDYFIRRGFRNVLELDWFDEKFMDPLRITSLPSVHWSKRGFAGENKSLWTGYAIEADGTKVYFSGDTGYGKIFKELGDRHGPFDLSLIGIGAYEPRSIMRASHATPEEAVRIARDMRSENILGMHWGTVILSDEPPFEPPRRFHAAAIDIGFTHNQIWRLAIGETRPLPA